MPLAKAFALSSKQAQDQPIPATTAAPRIPCATKFNLPQPVPNLATQYNGAEIKASFASCQPATSDRMHHIFVIGDWGGLAPPYHPWNKSELGVLAADHRSRKMFRKWYRPYVYGVDDFGQKKVASAMAERARLNEPDYILNVGDSFYWGGLNVRCGTRGDQCADTTGQWKHVFEEMYMGVGIDGKQWLGVLGNHDYGGYKFTAGWDQIITYSWLSTPPSTGRWIVPGQYWTAHVEYTDFSIDYFFADTNVFDTWQTKKYPGVNICGTHNAAGSTCGAEGPSSVTGCPEWFSDLWNKQNKWLRRHLSDSTADWQIIVVHHPPEGAWGGHYWKQVSHQYGIDILFSGHRHKQEVHTPGCQGNELTPTTYAVCGGGGGITSEEEPKLDGEDDQYGFMDVTLSREQIVIEAISHGGLRRSKTCVHRRLADGTLEPLSVPSMCTDQLT